MASSWFLVLHCIFSLLLLACTNINGEVHVHDFIVQQTAVKRLCKTTKVIMVNGKLPGPTIAVKDGDSLVINVINKAKHNVTLHWHGVKQKRTGWADGPEYITQCPIKPGNNYTYRFTITEQEGTLFWHAHISWLRATVYGAFIIYPKEGSQYPFALPDGEAHVLLGEWWKENPIKVINKATKTGGAPDLSDALTINGQPGDLYNCSRADTTVFPVTSGKTYLYRIINAALNTELFVSIAGHNMTVVASDATYVKPFVTDNFMITPGQTIDVLIHTNQNPGNYYIAARAYVSSPNVAVDNTTTTAILRYNNSNLSPIMPTLPAYNDTATVTEVCNKFKSLNPTTLPGPVDHDLFFTVGINLIDCPNQKCLGPNNKRFAASMNNVSFQFPTTSILQAARFNISNVFTADFPATPPLVFDYTAANIPQELWQPIKATKVFPLKYNSVVQLVLQDTNILAGENHPIHLHGHDFYCLGTGFGNYDPEKDASKLNMVDPPMRNTVGVPVNGWAVIRFLANNPGAWYMHCHLDVHVTWGLSTVFLVEDGDGPDEKLEPLPADYPPC